MLAPVEEECEVFAVLGDSQCYIGHGSGKHCCVLGIEQVLALRRLRRGPFCTRGLKK